MRRGLPSCLITLSDAQDAVDSDLSQRIGTLEERPKQLNAKQHRIEAPRRSLESRRTRREDTRGKILVGAIVLAEDDQDVFSEATLRGMARSGAHARGRELFGI